MKKLTILTVTFLFVMSTVGYAAQSMSALTSQLKQATNGRAKISYHNKTGMVRALSVKDGFALPQPFTLPLNITAENAARSFLAMYGSLFGIQDQSKELKLERQKKGLKDRSVLRFQQVYKGIPVMAGELIVHLDALKSVLSVNGEIAPRPLIDTSATISASEAEETALALVAKSYKVDQSELTASEPELWIYNPALLGTWPNQDILVWRMEVTAKELLPIDELVLIDANNGSVALNFNQINYAKDRVIYNGYNNYLCDFDLCGPPWYEGEPPTGDNDVDNIYEYLGDAYDFYFNQFGRKSIDNKEMSIIATARYCSPIHECPLKNAMWSPSAKKLAFGQYVNADDWIGHEYTHGVTQYESNLFYYMQSGAINESLSDIFGEFIDLTNGSGFDDPSAKWIFGEELYLYLGNYRNIKDPTNSFDLNGGGEQPDKMSSTYYLCGSGDNGGVHKNDGIGNKAAYLITDGDTFNGKTVSGIGLDKTARLYYLVQTKCLTSGSDYADLYTCLQSACEYLKDVGYVTESDCQQVTNAIDAVEMDQQPTQCAALEAPYCDTDKHIKWFYYDDFESGAVGWVPSDLSLWEVSEKYAVSKSHSLHGKDAGYSSYASTFSPVIGPLPANAYLHFKHAYHFEYSDTENCDGGIIGYSTDGGNNWYDAESLIVDNGYNGEITSITNNFLWGRNAFVGTSNGFSSSRLDLTDQIGQYISFSFGIGTDALIGTPYGWYIDDFAVYTCVDCIDNSNCDDGNACNGIETCLSDGTCSTGTPPNCNDSNPCTTDACNTTLGCLNTPVTNGTSCSDGNICNGSETCQTGICTAGTSLNCNDGNICTTDTCIPAIGCQYVSVSNGTSCDDGAFCNGLSTCIGGACTAGANPCPGQICNESTDQCVQCLNNSNCSDGAFCNGQETCVAGACQSGTPPCSQYCDESKDLCVACLNNSHCNDNLFCNGVETCVSGSCQNGAAPCAAQLCVEGQDTCLECVSGADCPANKLCDDNTCKAQYTLTVDLPGYDSPAYVEALYEGNKVILHDGNQYSYLEGASVQLTAVVSPITLTSQKPIFAGWAGDLDGFDNPETIIMDENKTVLFKSLMASSPDWNVTMANCVDPYSLPVTTTLNMPNFMPYGLINIAMAADTVTMTASFNVSLPEPAPAGAKWYKCSKSTSCIDFSRDVISGGTGDGAEFNADRTIVTVHLTDNGPYDDNPAYDIILDPSGLGMECLGQNDCSDGLFCNGVETCDEGECIAGSAPCSAQQTCNESNDTCTNPVNPTTTSIPKSGGGGSSGGGGGAAPVTSSSTTSTLVSTTSTSTIPQVNTTTSTSVEPPAPETTTTTSIEEAKCPLQQTLGVEAYAELDALRMFRDTRLARTPSGLLLITLYYAHSQEITAILASYPDLMEQTKGLVIDMLPVIYNATMTDRPLIMTDSQYQKITTLMQAVQSKASPKLSTTITYILEKLESGELIKELN